MHEFGSPSRNIPERSFLRLTATQRSGDYQNWIKSNKENIFKAVTTNSVSSIYQKIGALWVSYVHDTFFSGGYGKWPRLKPSTIMARTKGRGPGPVRPLIDTGALVDSIMYEVKEE